MFSPPNTPNVSSWFQRLEAAWRRMPAEERTRQREEVQQHLAGLVAEKVAQGQPSEDAWNAALKQFGDPTQIGRKIYHEWCQSKTGFRADVSAIAFGTCWITLAHFAGDCYRFFDGYQTNHHQLYHHLLVPIIFTCVSWLIPVAIGLKYPLQAIKSW